MIDYHISKVIASTKTCVYRLRVEGRCGGCRFCFDYTSHNSIGYALQTATHTSSKTLINNITHVLLIAKTMTTTTYFILADLSKKHITLIVITTIATIVIVINLFALLH